MHAALHCFNMWPFYLAMQHHLDCGTPLWKACRFKKHLHHSCPSCVVCNLHKCCLPDAIPGRVSSSPVLTQQSAGRCTSCPKWRCSQVSPCLSSQQVDNPALCNYAVNYYFKIVASNCLIKTPTKIPPRRSPCSHKIRQSITAPILNGSKNQNSKLYIKPPSQRALFQPFLSPKVRPSLFAAKLDRPGKSTGLKLSD